MGCPKVDFTIDKAVLFQFPDEDLEVIRNDWKILMDKIKAGQAHLISEGDTMYLAACPKGRNSQDTRSQPFSPIPAMKRAYSLKSSYMTQILRRYIFGDEPCEKIIKDPAALRTTSFEDWFSAKVRPYVGMSRTELKARLGVETNAKNLNELFSGSDAWRERASVEHRGIPKGRYPTESHHCGGRWKYRTECVLSEDGFLCDDERNVGRVCAL